MTRPYASLLIAATSAILLSACVGSSDKYPSLVIRDFERAQGQFTPVAGEPEAPIRPVASSEDLDALVARAVDAYRRFEQVEMGTIILVAMAQNDSIESNRRQEALVAFANLQAIRSETAVVLADLDRLTAEAVTTFAPQEEIAAARAKVETLIAGQDGTLAGLSETMNQ
ncbi:hypothetical protein [Erythrobacter sp. F6033]|uniref:hypothetical protein n=1 Tax=Erythrobacter sp. F6033 TaxID=2926401 RepID=UPI001FF377B4|nr:hypothetical protein [Erythrobacter sp. F6033]MCK0128800.1 hypothetical protein [Erythrobacter sp. F6033]